MIRVAIVDDHPIARLGIQDALARAGSVMVVAAVASVPELAEHLAAAESAPDVVVLDLYHDGDRPCLEEIRDLAAGAGTKVLVVSASGRPDEVVGAIRAGAVGYLTKHAEVSVLLGAVETVAAGGFALSAQLADILRASGTTAADAPRALSPREAETLDLIARGLTHAQAATRMGVSKGTVDTYVERIRSKLQVGNKAELARAAFTRLRGQAPP